jgi:fructokinase
MLRSTTLPNRQSTIRNRKFPEVLCLGELLVDLVPEPLGAPLPQAKSLKIAAGGAPANVAVALKRLGVSSGFIGKVGDDPFGRFLRDALVREELDLRSLGQTSKSLTRLACVTNDANEGQRFVFYGSPGADALLQAGDIQSDYLRHARVFHFGSISLIQEPARSATLKALKLAHKFDLTISSDPNLRPALWASLQKARTEILRTLSQCHVLERELRSKQTTTPADEEEITKRLQGLGYIE